MNSGKPTFKWNLDDGEGSIGNLDKFRQLDGLMRMDLLTDWMFELQKEYEFAYSDHNAYLLELKASMVKASSTS